MTFTGPAVGDNEAGRSPWEGKASRLQTVGALCAFLWGDVDSGLISAQPDVSLVFELPWRSSTVGSPRMGSAVPHLLG